MYHHQRSLDRHVRSSHISQPTSSCDQCGKSIIRSDNLERHKRTCTGHRTTAAVAPAPATTTDARPTGKLQFTLQQTRRMLGDAVEQFTVNMKEAKRLPTLKKAVNVLEPAMVKFHRDHLSHKFQIAVSVVFHKAVDSAVVTHPPVVLTSEMVAI